MKRLIAFVAVFVLFSPPVMADIIIFKSGYAREGIIEEETPTSVKMRIKNATIGFSRDNIEKIEHSSPEDNRKLDEKWKEQEREQEEKRKQKREKKELEDKRMREKGLEQVDGKWVSRREKARIEQERIKAQESALKRQKAEQARQKALNEATTPREGETEADLRARNIAQIVVGKFDIKKTATEEEVLEGRITNKGKLTAGTVSLRINFYDDKGTLISRTDQQVSELGPNERADVQVPLGYSSGAIGRTEVIVTDVSFR